MRTKSVTEVYDRIAADFSRTRSRSWPEWDSFSPYLSSGLSLLDAGCGNGRFFDFVRRHDVSYCGLDISTNLLSEARKKHPDLRLIEGDIRFLPFGDDEFDLVASIAVLHHLKNNNEQLQALDEAKRVLRTNGYLLLMVWNLWSNSHYRTFRLEARLKAKKNPTHSPQDFYIPWGEEKILRYYYAFQFEELADLLKKSGFKLVKMAFTKNNQVGVIPSDAFNILAICQKK